MRSRFLRFRDSDFLPHPANFILGVDVLREYNVALALTDTSFMPRPWEAQNYASGQRFRTAST